MTQVDGLIETYLTACAVEGKSPNTVFSYRASLADFRRVGRSLDFPVSIGDYTVREVYAFLDQIRTRGASPAYRHRRHREVKAFFSWCRRMGYVEDNPFARVPLVKLEQQIIQPFSEHEVRLLLASQDRQTYAGSRNYALFLFLLDTGVRASECVSVRLEDVDWERRRVRVLHGKGNKQRWVAIGEQTSNALCAYLRGFRGEEFGPLFQSREGNALPSHALNVLMKRTADRLGLTGVHPHRFRHTFATWAIRAKAREIDVQALLGHSSLAMVQRYARTYSSEQAVEAHGAFSPVGQLTL
jgi:site-specific recombinase XerD